MMVMMMSLQIEILMQMMRENRDSDANDERK